MNIPELDNLRVKLSNLDGNDSENVTYKVITRFLKLGRDYSSLLSFSNVRIFPWILIRRDHLRVQKEKETKICSRVFTSSVKRHVKVDVH